MCGIAGIINYSENLKEIKKNIKQIIIAQDNRGPDNNDIWVSSCNKVSLGHNRLSIIDLTNNANQPFISHDGNFIITFNGEIYNYLEIKKELLSSNVKFRSNSDTEVLIEAYKKWGINFLLKLRGMYAFAIYDKIKKKMFLARDPFGIKPLYYINKNKIFYFASEIKALKKINNIDFKKTNNSILQYYIWGNMEGNKTIYNDIYLLEEGSYKVIDDNGDVFDCKFADIKEKIINSNKSNFKNKNELGDYLKEIFDETVSYHHISDVPVSILLSSGIDSSVIAASSKNNKNLNSLTLEFPDNENKKSESYLAKKTAKINNIEHYVDYISKEEMNDLTNFFFKKMDSPTNDGLNVYYISYLAKKLKSKVIISGIGGDEFFMGYPSFDRIPKINDFFSKLKYNKNIDKIYQYFSKILIKTLRLNPKISKIYSHGSEPEKTFFLQRSLFTKDEIEEILDKDIFIQAWKELNIFEKLKKDVDKIEDHRLKIMFLEIKYYLIPKLLRDADWASMSNSVELRTPFVDWQFFEKLLPILKSNVKIDKLFLANLYKKNIPNEIFRRKKTGFSLPYRSIMKNVYKSNIKYNHPNKDWSLLSINNYLNNQ